MVGSFDETAVGLQLFREGGQKQISPGAAPAARARALPEAREVHGQPTVSCKDLNRSLYIYVLFHDLTLRDRSPKDQACPIQVLATLNY